MSKRGLPSVETAGLHHGNLRAGMAGLGGALTLFLLYTAGLLEGLDHAGLSLMQGLRSESLTKRVLEISALGSLPALFLIGLVSVAYLYALGEQKTTRRIFFIMVAAEVLAFTAKHLVARPRPEDFFAPGAADTIGSNYLVSFPSGHSMMSAVMYLSVALLLCKAVEGRKPRLVLTCTAIALILAIGLSRIYLGVHNPSDVLAGWLGGTGWTLAWFAIFSRRDRLAAADPEPAAD